ncbi:MAG TPA: choice-of-anchor D domain-containing protein, partial [Terriglobus sp.]
AHSSVASTNAVFTITDECSATLQPHSVCRIAMDYLSSSAPSSDALSLVVDGISVTVLGETLPQPSIGGATANPNLTLSATSVAFSDPVTVTTASSSVQTVTIGNVGGVPFALQIAVTGDFTQTTDCPATLPGSTSCSVNIVFTPSAVGLRQGLLAVTAGSASPAYVALRGTGSAILPPNNGVAFGDIPLNTPSVQWLKVQQGLVSATASSSDAAYQVILVEDTGYGHGQPPASNFSATATGSCLNCWLGIQFRPVTTGVDIAAVSLSSISAGKPTSVMVSGNGVPLSGLILTPLMEDFGPVAVHSSSASTHFQLTNATSVAITTRGVSITGDFSVTAETTGGFDCAAATLAPGASCFVSVQFSPTATGTRTGQLAVQTSAGAAVAMITGTGSVDPGTSFTPGELQFDNAPGASATQQALSLTNTSAAVETIGTPILSDSHFSANSACSTLAPSATCTITVTYAPTAALSNGTLSIPVTTSPAGAPYTTTYTVMLTGQYTSESAGIQIIPGEHTTVNFGAASTDTLSSSRVLHVNNLSGKALTVDIAAPRNFSVGVNTCTTLAPNGSCDLSVQFVPQIAGSLTGTIFVQGTPTDGSETQDGLGYLEGYGQGVGNLSITGNLSVLGILSFGQVTSGQTASQTITLTNPVSATTSVTVRRIQSATPFLTTTTCGQPLAPGQSCTTAVTYAPVYQITGSTALIAARADTSSIAIESNASTAPQFVNLSGQVAPVSSVNAVNGEQLQTYSLSRSSLTFANTAVGSSSPTQSVILTNTGTATVHIEKLIASAGFAASGNCGILLAGATCNISAAYQPQTAGTATGTIEIQSDAATSLEFMTLVGTGSPASVSLSPRSLDFGRVLVGSSGSQFATLTNTGAVAVTLNGVTVSGTDFSLASSSTSTSPCPVGGGTLNAGASCTIAITFKPSTATTIRGTLSVATSATALPLTVVLSGVGTQPLLAVAPTSLSFGNVVLGSNSTLSLTLHNGGTSAVDGLAFSTTKDFSVTSTCGITTLNAGSSCSVSVTYRPTITGYATGALAIRSTDPASPLLVALTGTGIASTPGTGGGILLTVNGASSASATVVQGISATYALSVTPTNGYSGNVALTCTPDSTVAYATCSILPSTVSLKNEAQRSTATITTVMEINTSQLQPMTERKAVLALLIPGGALLLWFRRRRYVALPLLLMMAFCIIGCGVGPDPHLRYMAQGTYGFHVTASSTNGTITSQSVSLTLIVGAKNSP